MEKVLRLYVWLRGKYAYMVVLVKHSWLELEGNSYCMFQLAQLSCQLMQRPTYRLFAVCKELWSGGVGCIQNQDIDTTEFGHSFVHYGLTVFLLRHIGNDCVHIRGVLKTVLSCLFEFVGGSCSYYHPVSNGGDVWCYGNGHQ